MFATALLALSATLLPQASAAEKSFDGFTSSHSLAYELGLADDHLFSSLLETKDGDLLAAVIFRTKDATVGVILSEDSCEGAYTDGCFEGYQIQQAVVSEDAVMSTSLSSELQQAGFGYLGHTNWAHSRVDTYSLDPVDGFGLDSSLHAILDGETGVMSLIGEGGVLASMDGFADQFQMGMGPLPAYLLGVASSFTVWAVTELYDDTWGLPIDHPDADPDEDGIPNRLDPDDDGDDVFDTEDSWPYDGNHSLYEDPDITEIFGETVGF